MPDERYVIDVLVYQFAIKAAEKQNNKKICHICHHNFKNIPCYVMSEVSLKRFYFALFDDGLTLKTLKLAIIGFLIQTLQIHSSIVIVPVNTDCKVKKKISVCAMLRNQDLGQAKILIQIAPYI